MSRTPALLQTWMLCSGVVLSNYNNAAPPTDSSQVGRLQSMTANPKGKLFEPSLDLNNQPTNTIQLDVNLPPNAPLQSYHWRCPNFHPSPPPPNPLDLAADHLTAFAVSTPLHARQPPPCTKLSTIQPIRNTHPLFHISPPGTHSHPAPSQHSLNPHTTH